MYCVCNKTFIIIIIIMSVYCSGGGVDWCPRHICSAQMKCHQRPLPFLTSAAEYTFLSCVQRCQLGILCVGAAHTFLLQSVPTW